MRFIVRGTLRIKQCSLSAILDVLRINAILGACLKKLRSGKQSGSSSTSRQLALSAARPGLKIFPHRSGRMLHAKRSRSGGLERVRNVGDDGSGAGVVCVAEWRAQVGF